MEYMIGIYSITNLKNGKRYIGSSTRVQRRFYEHRGMLNRGCHINVYLQKSWVKHGRDNFKFEILEECPQDDLIEREEFWIEHFQSYKEETGYNLSKCPSRPRLGQKASPETLLKMSISNGGENHPNWGRKLSRSHVDNMKRAVKGIKKPTSGRKKVYLMVSPVGETIEVVGLRKFCRENGLVHSMFWRVATGKQSEYKGWKKV